MIGLVIVLQLATSVTAIASLYATVLSLNLMQANNQLLEELENDNSFALINPPRQVEKV